MAEECNCEETEETHEHCTECDAILNWHESENLCMWCEERITGEWHTY